MLIWIMLGCWVSHISRGAVFIYPSCGFPTARHRCTQLKEVQIGQLPDLSITMFCDFPSDCPADGRTWVPFGNGCYHFVHGEEDKIKSYTFERAKTLCRGFGTCDILFSHILPNTKSQVDGVLSVCVCDSVVLRCNASFQSFWPSRALKRMTLSLNIAQRCGKALSTCGWECIMTQTVSTVCLEDCGNMLVNFHKPKFP